MEQKIPKRSRWKIPQVETFYYQFHFLNYFSKHNPEFIREMETDLFPLYLEIFGKHEETTPLLSEYNWLLIPAIVEKDYLRFAMNVETKLSVFNKETINYQEFPKKNLKVKTDILLDKIISIIKRHNLFFGNDDEYIESWLIHSLLCQVEAGMPYLITPMRQIVYELPFKMLEKLWRELPEIEQILFMKSHETYYKQLSPYNSRKKHFESLDIFMANYPYKTLPAAPMFAFREYNIYEDVENYEKIAVKAFKEHIKNYVKRIDKSFKENGFKRNKTDDYSQTEWLVLWNKGIKNKEDILKDIGSDGDESTINTAFRKFKKHGLPVRKKNKKNLEDKKT